jgi:hypothetical protein
MVGNRRFKRKHRFMSNETAIRNEIQLVEKKSSNADLILEESDYSYPFEFTIAQDLPTSFEHAHARVRYSVRAIIDIPWSFNLYAAISFTVINKLDLNGMKPQTRQPLSQSVQPIKTLGCLTGHIDPISIKFSINKSKTNIQVFSIGFKESNIFKLFRHLGVFVPGERIFFNVTIKNKTKHELSNIRVCLVQETKVNAQRKQRKYKKSMAFMSLSKSVASLSEENWSASFRIPATCPTLTGLSRILKINYFFKLGVDSSETESTKNELSIPITIGSIPLQEQSVTHSSKKSNSSKNQEVMYTFETDNTENDDPLPPYEYEKSGEAMQSDLHRYIPYYLFYKDFSNLDS